MSAEQIETIYELTPMQQGMLFHSVSAPQAGVYVEQVSCRLHGDLDVAAFARAWQHVVARHAILRTAFYWENLEKPLQVVYRAVDLPLEQQDWRDLLTEEQAARLNTYLAADRRRGFDIGQPPLLRLLLARLDSEAYQLVWSHHHILLDGWSLPLLLNEVLTCYESFRQDRSLRLEQPRPFSDYIVWLQSQDQAQAEQFWRQTLRGFTTPSTLSHERTPHQAASKFADVRTTFSAQSTAALQAHARRHGLTLNTLVQGAWALLLSRYTGASDVLFGATVSGRPADLAGVETMIGLFINTQPVRLHVPPTANIVAWLQQLQAQQAALWRYQYTPLVEIQRWSEIPPGQPLFESILVFENYPLSDVAERWDGSVELADARFYEQTNYPLTVVAAPGVELGLQISYDCRRFSADQARRYLEYLRMLLPALAANPAQRIDDLPTLTPADQQIVDAWNTTATPRPELCIHQLFEAQVARTPNAVALVFVEVGTEPAQQVQLTYRELNERANQLAHALRARGVDRETPVGLCMDRSLELIVGLLAILKAGAYYVPLDPAAPAERLAWMIADTQMALLLTQTRIAPALATTNVELICLDGDWSLFADHERANPVNRGSPANLAYAIYTSGSTGQPKAVLIEQRALVNHALTLRERYALTPADRLLQFAAPSFDAAGEEIYPTLISGAALVIPSTTLLSNAALGRLCDQQAITVLHLPAALWQHWTVELRPDAAPVLPTLRMALVGGNSPERDSLQRWHQALGRVVPLLHAYGPTETTITATLYEAGAEQIGELQTGRLPIGTPIANTQAYILDAHMRHVPLGAFGELYIGGVGVARGYLNQPALSAEKFVPDPFGGNVGTRLYRTGDLVRGHADGAIEFLGRIDRQVKLRGFRIELAEIEATLSRHPDVRQSVVVAREDRPGDVRLVAYVVGEQRNKGTKEQDGTGTVDPSHTLEQQNVAVGARHAVPGTGEQDTDVLDASELRGYLSEHLPEYMLPSAFVVLPALPLTAHGKIDERALSAPDTSELLQADTQPGTQITELLAGLWADVLGREHVGLHDNFFELGGHSLLATRVVSHVRSAFQVELSLLSIFESPTIAELSRQIEREFQAEHAVTLPPIRPANVDRAPLSFSQERMWSVLRRDPGNPAFNIPIVVRLIGSLNLSALERSLNTIVQRHAALRTTIVEDDAGPVQVIKPTLTVSLPVVDLGDRSPAERTAELERATEDAAQHRFDPLRGPLLHSLVLRLDQAEHVLLLTLHHLVADGWSIGVLGRELGLLYTALVAACEDDVQQREAIPANLLPPLPAQYADYTIWQRALLTGEVLDRQRAYWQQQLADAPPILALPTDYPRPPVRSFGGAHHSVQLSQTLSSQLRSLSRQESCTLFMTLLAAFDLLLWRMTGQTDIVVGSPSAGRMHAETEQLIGLFINTLPLRVRVAADLTFQELLGEVRETTLAAYAHQSMPLGLILETIQPPHDPRYAPLFQVIFNMLNVPAIELELPELIVTGLPPGNVGSKFDFTLYVYEADRSIQLDLVYNTDLFTSERMERLLAQFQALLAAIVAGPDRQIVQLVEPLRL